MAPLLEVEDLHIEFRTDDGSVKAVRGVSFSLEEGEVLGLVGESGCGKSVTTLALMGLIRRPGVITQGTIRYKGQDVTHFRDKEWRQLRGKELAMIFQDPMTSLNPFMRIGHQIIEVLTLHTDLKPKEKRVKAAALLDSVGLPDPASRLDVYPHQLSGGMRQRVMIAMALAASPKILLADEPTTALDVTIQAQILDLLDGLQRSQGISILMITHDLGIVADFCDRVHVMYAGQIVEKGETDALFERPLHPYTEGLLGSVPSLEADTQSLKGIPGQPPQLLAPPQGCAFAPRCPKAQDDCLASLPPLAPVNGLDDDHTPETKSDERATEPDLPYVRCFHHNAKEEGAQP